MTVREAATDLVHHPVSRLIGRWNWKAAMLSATMRGAIFFGTNLGSGILTATRVLMIDAAFRIPLAGAYAAVIQAFRAVEPLWVAATIVVLGMPVTAHIVEFSVHYAAGTPAIARSVAFSIGASIVSSSVELLAMRRGLLLVGPGAASFRDDLRRVQTMMTESWR